MTPLDQFAQGKLDDLARWYAPQIRHYRRYWSKLTGRPTRAGLFFVETGQEVWLPEMES